MEKINHIITLLVILSWIAIVFLYKDIVNVKRFMHDVINSLKKVKKMEFNAKLSSSYYTEFNGFIGEYNEMVDILEKYFNQVEGKNIQLNSILKSVSNGILVVDISNKVFLINDKAKEYLDCPADLLVEHKSIYEVIKDKKILDFLRYNISSDTNISKEIKLENGKIYNIKIDPISMDSRKTILIASVVNIEDITERIKLENMRRDFAANVSHELKTPLTSIQGFVETLKENDETIEPEMRKRFLEIIENESYRLRILINDILLLSSIEGDEGLEFEWVDVKEVNERIFGILDKKSKKYGVDLICQYNMEENSQGEILLYTQKQYFKELIINLMTNGIKYNKSGGFVKVIYEEDEKNYYITVEDNGIGIDEEEKERIFERFYRVSKSRNKDIEGTGLGLAIVKHILISLGGNIELDSKIGEGSSFRISLPQNINTTYLHENRV